MEYDIALIQQTDIFNGLSAFEIKQVFEECASLKEFTAMEKIIEEASVNDDLYFLPKGKVQVDLELSVKSWVAFLTFSEKFRLSFANC